MRTWRERVRGGGLSSYPPQFPRQFQTLLHLSWSTMHLRDREERVKDLVMAARYEKQRVETTPEAMLPPMPNLSDLRPYPSTLGLTYNGHIGRVTCLSISPCGQWLASISPVDGCLRIWETETNYCFRCYRLLPGNLRALRQANEWRSVVLGKQKRKCEKVQKINENSQDDLQEVPQQGAESDDESGWTYHRPNALVAWNPNPDIHLVAAAMLVLMIY
ncbi:unnamed protein product [Protopolystoma xenopodis]|uniref:BOP1 N-terminal domain-containing protein n=1 Tax=Protopolystoma xenopodis TaxID=117903 RepID=A0A448WYV7_9PLAT|nr:unnamed protein product [Protopolystoma xenopodis]